MDWLWCTLGRGNRTSRTGGILFGISLVEIFQALRMDDEIKICNSDEIIGYLNKENYF